MHHDTVWTFQTARYRVELQIMPEDTDPADSFDFQEDIDAVRNGEVDWFAARVVVFKDGYEIGSDSLGANAYKNVREFYTEHRDPDPMNRNCSIMRASRGQNVSIGHYFPSMVSEAIKEARRTLDGDLRKTA